MRKLLVLSVCAVAILLASCGSESEFRSENDNLTESISNDFNSRYKGFAIKSVSVSNDFYRDSDRQETFIRCVDSYGDERIVAYVNNKWNRSVRVLADKSQLPYAVQNTLEGETPNEIDLIKEAEFAGIGNKEYIIHYKRDIPFAKNCVHTLIVNDNGMVLRKCSYSLNDPDCIYPFAEDISWIMRRYKNATILGYINDLGDDEYIIEHGGVIKTVLFRPNAQPYWKKTTYPLQPNMTIPQHVLDKLKATAPNFTYTDVTVVETEEGNGFIFTDNSKVDRPAYIIGDDEI